MKKIQFVVDAALLQELGERLIGRPAIALGELVKNSFDADATTCLIEFGSDEIVVSDDGSGMSENDFLNYWMRLGTTHKVDQGVSGKFGRSLTGSKGIGRLSAQFLSTEMTLESAIGKDVKSLYAIVDWSNIVRGKDLETVDVEWEMRKESYRYPHGSSSGTRITLNKLKSDWDADALRALGDQVWMLQSPFKSIRGRTGNSRSEDFVIEIEAPDISGARDAFDENLRAVFSSWKARIRGSVKNGRSRGKAFVTVDYRAGYPDGTEKNNRFKVTADLPIRGHDDKGKTLIDRASFEVLIFRTKGRQPGGISVHDLRDYLAKFGNVSVYDAGFRLPYYGSGRDAVGQDWLSMAADHGRRLNVSELLPERFRTTNKYMQALPAPGRIFGAVEVDTNHERVAAKEFGDWLEIQPGRDRLKDNQAFDQVRDLVRFSLDFYANRYRLLDLQVSEKKREKDPPSRKYERAIKVLDDHKKDIPVPVYREVRREVTNARKASLKEEVAIDRRAALLAPLASAGMAALALNHEISRESVFLNDIGLRLRRIAKKHAIPELQEIASEFVKAKRRLDSLQELFAPLHSESDMLATDRLRIRAVVEQTVDSMRILMPNVRFNCTLIPTNLRFPLGSLAEWNALLQNVLSNAWNAMLDTEKAEMLFQGGTSKRGGEWLRVSDTGQGLDIPLSEAEKLFEPFERRLEISDDKKSIAIGGQGLGLAIVRMIAHRRSAKVDFVKPEHGFSTTFEISWRGGTR